jgi:hypothetical protein
MNVTVRRMSPLQRLLETHGIHTIRRLRELTGLTSQQCWNLWHGRVGVGRKTAQLLHDRCGIPYEELMRLPPVPHASRFGRPSPPHPPAEG